MNRWDEIKAAALDAAQHVTQDPEKRNAMADDLIRLVGLMIQGVGKSVAADGESDMGLASCNDPDCDCGENGCAVNARSAHTRYLTGERIQDGARWAVDESVAADLGRYEGGQYDSPVWRPRCPDCGVRVGMHENVRFTETERLFDVVKHADGCPTGRRCVECLSALGHFPSCPSRRRSAITETVKSQVDAGMIRVGSPGLVPPSTGCPECKRYNSHKMDCSMARPAADVDTHVCTWVVARDGDDRPAMDARGLSWQHCCICRAHRPGCRCTTCVVPDRCPGCGEEPSHGTACVAGF